jgi:hypothetical protein
MRYIISVTYLQNKNKKKALHIIVFFVCLCVCVYIFFLYKIYIALRQMTRPGSILEGFRYTLVKKFDRHALESGLFPLS